MNVIHGLNGRTRSCVLSVEEPILDGFGKLFDPARHLEFMRNAKGDEAFVPPEPPPNLVQYEAKHDQPAGWWDKSDKMGYRL